MVVPLSQAGLARATRRSAGTVAYYLHQAGPEVVSARRDALVVDVNALQTARAEHRQRHRLRAEPLVAGLVGTWGRHTDPGEEIELVGPGGRPPTEADVAQHLGISRGTAHRRLANLERAGMLRRELGRTFVTSPSGTTPAPPTDSPASTSLAPPPDVDDSGLLRTLLELFGDLLCLVSDYLTRDPRSKDAQDPRNCVAQIADLRDGASRLAGVLESGYAQGPLDTANGSDIVLWIAIRHHHEPRWKAEETYFLPYHYKGFHISPRGFEVLRQDRRDDD